MFVPTVFKPHLYELRSAIQSIKELSNPKYCKRVFPLELAPYPAILFPLAFSSLIKDTVLSLKALISLKKLFQISTESNFNVFSYSNNELILKLRISLYG